MPDVGQDCSLGDTIAAQAISDEASRPVSQPMQQALEETLGGCPVPPILYQDVEHDPVLVHRAPQIVQHAPDADEQGARYVRAATAAGAVSWRTPHRTSSTKAECFRGSLRCRVDQDKLDVAQAEAEDVIQPDGMADDLGRNPMPRIRGWLGCHDVSLAHLPFKRQQRPTWQCHADSIGQMMVRLESGDQLRQANGAVLRHLRAAPIVSLWAGAPCLG